ncbi:MAG: hypothetical protein A3J74_06255 [Elusimicrobia bacterium RIFCSPHIGHO2_02_FULL_57_9]|nr:MAG: hypothetical protein A3J74_06255 [Elusimicrobia bacterium RIFCSPHIGHO2_02_FULL_57_9]
MAKQLLAVLFLAACRPASAAGDVKFQGMDIYRSEAVTVEQIERHAGGMIKNYMRLRAQDRKESVKVAERLRPQIETRARQLGKFAFLKFHYGEYVTSAERTAYVTFDIVDAKDAKERMPFRPIPARHLKDPNGLLAAWRQYSDLGVALMKQGLISTDRPTCPAFYCPRGTATPELAAFERRFAEAVPIDKALLLEVLKNEADPHKRAAALYLLSYLKDGKEVLRIMMMGLDDPGEDVRAAAMQILADISLNYKSLFMEVNRIIALLDYPTVSDRSKSLALLVSIADNPVYRPYIMSRATPYLVRLLKMNQPSHHDLAYTLLAMLSQETYDRRDYSSWEKWVSKQIIATTPAPRRFDGH